jgi:hypothetical protein
MEKDIGKINKNSTTDIIVRIDDFGGRKGVTIREFVTSDRYTGFTKAGVKIPAKDFKKFKEMVNSISEDELSEDSGESKELPEGQKKLSNSEDEMMDY